MIGSVSVPLKDSTARSPRGKIKIEDSQNNIRFVQARIRARKLTINE